LDRGPQFNAKFLRALYKALQIKPTFSTAYHPRTDGQSERLNQWLEGDLRAFINHRQTDWAGWLVLTEFTHNNGQSDATGCSPFQIVYGHSPVISPSLEPTGTPVANNRAGELAKVIAEVKATLQWTQERYKRADKGNSVPKFQVGDNVWLLGTHIKSQHPNKKLDHKGLLASAP
jgi:transposase InsO family protein